MSNTHDNMVHGRRAVLGEFDSYLPSEEGEELLSEAEEVLRLGTEPAWKKLGHRALDAYERNEAYIWLTAVMSASIFVELKTF